MFGRNRRIAVELCVVAAIASVGWLVAAEGLLAQEQKSAPANEAVSGKWTEFFRLISEIGKLRGQGKPVEAAVAGNQALAIVREIVPPENEHILITLKAVAMLSESAEDWDAAGKLYAEALAWCQKQRGPGHWETTDARLALENMRQLRALKPGERRELRQAERLDQESSDLYDQGKFSEAIGPATQARDIRRKLLGEKHPKYARSLQRLAMLYEKIGEYAQAEPLYQRALKIRQATLGEQHPEYKATLRSLAVLMRAKAGKEKLAGFRRGWEEAVKLRHEGKLADAATAGSKALTALREFVLPDSINILDCLRWLAEVYELAEDWDAAALRRAEALAWCEEYRGKEHWETVSARLAVQNLEQLRARSPEQRQELKTAQRLLQNAAESNSKGDFAAAVKLAERACDIRKAILGEGHSDYATSLNWLAASYQGAGDYAQAAPFYKQALEILKAVLGERHPDYATSLNSLAGLYLEMGDYQHAEPLFEQTLDIKKATLGENHPDFAIGLGNLAMLYYRQGHYEWAEPLDRQALEILKAAVGEKHPHYATELNHLGLLYQAMGDYARAEPLYQQALEIRKKARGETHPDYATSLNNLAFLYDSMGDYARAEPLYQQALEINKKSLGEAHPDYAASLNNLAGLYHKMGDYARAEPLYKQAMEIRKKALGESHPEYAGSLNNLAELYDLKKDYARAAPLYRQALEIRKAALGERHPDFAASLNKLAGLYDSAGDYAQAEPLYRQALEIRKAALGERHPDYAASLNNLAGVYFAMGDYARAEPLLGQALEISKLALGEEHPEYTASMKNNLAALYYATGDYARAEPFFRQALSITRTSLEATSLVQSERQQLAMGQSLRYRLDGYISLGLTANLYAHNIFSSMLTWKGATLVRQRGMRLAAADPRLVKAFGRLQQVTRQLASLSRATPQKEEDRVDWRTRIADLTNQRERLEAELAAKSAAFRQVTQEVTLADLLKALPPDAALVDFLEFERSTPPKEKGGKIVWERQLVAFVVRHAKDPADEVTMLSLGPTAPIGTAIDTWRATFGMSPDGRVAGRLLREKIWEPLLPAIGDAKTVLVSTDGALGRLPLGALPGKAPGKYLLEEHRLAMLPVPQLLPALVFDNGKRELTRELLLLGDVDYDAAQNDGTAGTKKKTPRRAGEASSTPLTGQDLLPSSGKLFEPLTNTGGEIATIEKLFGRLFEIQPGVDPLPLVQRAATEANFRELAPQYRHLHLATHGFFADAKYASAFGEQGTRNAGNRAAHVEGEAAPVTGYDPGLLSGLALAGANREPVAGTDDGILSAQEIAVLQLGGVDSVVLSACDTGLGAVAGGEGLLGVQRAFQVAGARTTLASFWKVDDLVTRLLMEHFYRNLWERDMPRLDALREAQLHVLNHPEAIRGVDPPKADAPLRTSPRYWAAFTLSGDWR